jgi:hypothetical protein
VGHTPSFTQKGKNGCSRTLPSQVHHCIRLSGSFVSFFMLLVLNFIWVLLWTALIAFALRKDDRVVITNRSRPMPGRLRMAHGMSALTILLVFLVGHMTNHVIGIWNLASDIEVTGILGTIYRGSWLQPELVGLFVFQIISRLVLLGSRMTRSADLPGALQTTSEMYLAAFLISHMTAVFILDRIVLKVGPLSKTSRFGTSPCNGRSVLCKSELIEMK